MSRIKGERDNPLYDTDAGILHTSDSLSESPHGKFVQFFGAPGDPAGGASKKKGETAAGRTPNLSKGFVKKRQEID